MGNLEVRTTARLQYAEEGRDLQWRHFYQEDVVALRARLKEGQEEQHKTEEQHDAAVDLAMRRDCKIERLEQELNKAWEKEGE